MNNKNKDEEKYSNKSIRCTAGTTFGTSKEIDR